MRCEKKCECTYLCCNRTELKCYYTELKEAGVGEEHDLGSCRDPWDMCNLGFDIRTSHENTEYFVVASCMQCYFWCKCLS